MKLLYFSLSVLIYMGVWSTSTLIQLHLSGFLFVVWMIKKLLNYCRRRFNSTLASTQEQKEQTSVPCIMVGIFKHARTVQEEQTQLLFFFKYTFFFVELNFIILWEYTFFSIELNFIILWKYTFFSIELNYIILWKYTFYMSYSVIGWYYYYI